MEMQKTRAFAAASLGVQRSPRAGQRTTHSGQQESAISIFPTDPDLELAFDAFFLGLEFNDGVSSRKVF